jgi:hypothetical protein
MEEGLQSAAGLDEDLAIRSTYETPIMDLKDAYRGVPDAERYFDPERAPRQPTWRVMADLMLRREGNLDPSGDERRRYRALRLGRHDGDTLLSELLPYPHPKASDWLYARFGRYETRESYTSAMLPQRKRLLLGVLSDAPRDLVVCYGKTDWEHFESLFPEASWRHDAPFRIGLLDSTRIVLTEHFSGRGFNTNDQLRRLAEAAIG